MLQRILDLQAEINISDDKDQKDLDSLLASLRSLEGFEVCLMAGTSDGYLQQLHAGGFTPIEGGQEVILGTVVDKGVEPVTNGFLESYLIVNVPGQPLYKVFVNGIRGGFVLSKDTLQRILTEALMHDDGDKLRDVLKEVGVLPL